MIVKAFRAEPSVYKVYVSLELRRKFETFNEMIEFIKEMGELEQKQR